MQYKRFTFILFILGIFIGTVLMALAFTFNECKIKGAISSTIYHTQDSPYYYMVKDYVCFENLSQAKQAGFRPPLVLSY